MQAHTEGQAQLKRTNKKSRGADGASIRDSSSPNSAAFSSAASSPVDVDMPSRQDVNSDEVIAIQDLDCGEIISIDD